MRYTPESKDRVRDAVDFVGLVSERTDLRRAGSQWMGLCPFHEERSPSFSLDPVKKVYNCFGCGERGDVFSFVQQTQGLNFVQALEYLADRTHIELERAQEDPEAERRRAVQDRLRALLSRAAQFYSTYLWKAGEAEPARTYLAQRGLERAVLEQFQVGYAPAAGDKLLQAAAKAGFSAQDMVTAGLARRRGGRVEDAFRGRIIFPLSDHRGRVLAFAGRAMRDGDKPKYLNTSENKAVGFYKGQLLYGMDKARAAAMKTGRFVVVEGYTDVLALHQAGVPECVAIMGTSLTDHQLDELTRVQGTVFLALDADNAGKNATSRASRKAAERDTTLRVVVMPGGRDPAEIVTQDGADAFRALLDSALNVWAFQLGHQLDQSDLSSAEGRDRALQPTLAVIREAPVVYRQDLVRDAASRLDLPAAVIEHEAEAAPSPAARAEAARPTGSAPPAPAAEPAVGAGFQRPARVRPGSQVERAERVFLSLCLGLGETGMQYLRRSTPEHFATEVMRAARQHLLTHTGDPLAGLSADDKSVAPAVMEIVQTADEGEVSEQALRLSYLQLELRRVERDLQNAERRKDFERQRQLWGERESVRGEISELMGQTA
jgi:DNA primase